MIAYTTSRDATLVWELARKVNLHRGEKPEEGESEVRIETTMAALDAAFVALEEPGADDDATRENVRKALAEADADLKESALGQFLELVVSLYSTWRITTGWDGRHDGEQATIVRALAVWDCGPLGYWIREQPEEPITPGQVGPEVVSLVVQRQCVKDVCALSRGRDLW
ncbi:hypothetical protein [Streptomyces sp. P17]|uniref:hypothetical protein n=1 Tax=Streptomyces sp. P17 TaxID=3074716 RepID=UPI0028F3E2E8|nr:hypothetical protein [Streptomyces sp. P17]MDT9701470.1 hypothetical protein [Streptomyces sp. P17]